MMEVDVRIRGRIVDRLTAERVETYDNGEAMYIWVYSGTLGEWSGRITHRPEHGSTVLAAAILERARMYQQTNGLIEVPR